MAAGLLFECPNVIKMCSLLKNRLDDFGGGVGAEPTACEPRRYISTSLSNQIT